MSVKIIESADATRAWRVCDGCKAQAEVDIWPNGNTGFAPYWGLADGGPVRPGVRYQRDLCPDCSAKEPPDTRAPSTVRYEVRVELGKPIPPTQPVRSRPSFSCAHDVPCVGLPEFAEIIVHLTKSGWMWFGTKGRDFDGNGWDAAHDADEPVFALRSDVSSNCDDGAYFEVGYPDRDGTYTYDSVHSLADARRVTDASMR